MATGPSMIVPSPAATAERRAGGTGFSPRRVLDVAGRIVRQFLRDRRSLALLFLAPLFVMTILNLVLNSSSSDVTLGVVVDDALYSQIHARAPGGRHAQGGRRRRCAGLSRRFRQPIGLRPDPIAHAAAGRIESGRGQPAERAHTVVGRRTHPPRGERCAAIGHRRAGYHDDLPLRQVHPDGRAGAAAGRPVRILLRLLAHVGVVSA